jgi:hypothetical protein
MSFLVLQVDLAAKNQEALLKFISLHYTALVNDRKSFTVIMYLLHVAICPFPPSSFSITNSAGLC